MILPEGQGLYTKVKVFDFDRISGGDEENRTPVRKHCFTGFSERSSRFALRTQAPMSGLKSSDPSKMSRKIKGKPSPGIPQLASFPPVREQMGRGWR